jgi:hypothetical protein
MTTYAETPAPAATATRAGRGWPARAVAASGAVLALAVVPLFGDPLRGSDGGAVGDALVSVAMKAQLVAIAAVFASAALMVAAARLRAALPGLAGHVAGAAGTATAVLFAAYYSTFAAGAIVGDLVLTTRSPGLGEATLVVLNVVELVRFGTGFALLVAAAAALRTRALPRTVGIVAAVLAVAQALPMTGWLAALAVPVWLGVAGALARRA